MNYLFKEVLDNYLDYNIKVDKTKMYYRVIERQIPEAIADIIKNNQYLVKGSIGQGNKAKVSWIGIFNTNITTTAQEGIYIVYLFKADMSGFYLSLNQGVTHFKKYKEHKYKNMNRVAKYFKDQINDTTFSGEDIDLVTESSLGQDYEKINIISKYYDKDHMHKYELKKDLLELYEIYNKIYEDMNGLSYEEVISDIVYKVEQKEKEEELLKVSEDEEIYDSEIDIVENIEEYINNIIDVKIDRPMGSLHSKHGFVYPVNYGYVPNTMSGDGEELDVYVLGVFEPLDKFRGQCIAVIKRTNDNDDKLVVVPEGRHYTALQIKALTEFQERWFESDIII